MRRFFSRLAGKQGSAPGTMVYAGEREPHPLRLRSIVYDAASLADREVDVAEAIAAREVPGLVWIDVVGLADMGGLQRLVGAYGVHPLAQEDLVNTHQRPKFEAYPDHLLLVCRRLARAPGGDLEGEQISIVVGDGWLLTVQEKPGDDFEPVRQRLRQGRPRLREGGADYLAYALLDAVVDGYFGVVEEIAERVEGLEEELLRRGGRSDLASLYGLRHELGVVRRAVWPLREMVGNLLRDDSPLCGADTELYLRDVDDHAVQLADAIDSLRDLLASLQDLHLSTASHRMNEVMQVLTIMGSIFIPLTFLAGIYGMNFAHMPELAWPWAYPALLGVMAVIALGLVIWFRRRGWL
jgi:magnesium transporter